MSVEDTHAQLSVSAYNPIELDFSESIIMHWTTEFESLLLDYNTGAEKFGAV